jgi:hypothetical protein
LNAQTTAPGQNAEVSVLNVAIKVGNAFSRGAQGAGRMASR